MTPTEAVKAVLTCDTSDMPEVSKENWAAFAAWRKTRNMAIVSVHFSTPNHVPPEEINLDYLPVELTGFDWSKYLMLCEEGKIFPVIDGKKPTSEQVSRVYGLALIVPDTSGNLLVQCYPPTNR